jgi:hypothetical protein
MPETAEPPRQRRWRRRIALAAAGLALLVIAAFVALPWYIHLFIFRPDPLAEASPQAWGLERGETVSFPAADGSLLVGWWIAPSEGRPVVLILHGRSGNISGRAPVAALLGRQGYGVLLFDYRGYGRSGGSPSEEGLFEDALAAHDWVRRRRICAGRIVILGQSLGNAPAARLAASRPAAGLVLVSPFLSLPEAAADRLSWLPLGVVPWSRNRFQVGAHLARLQIPSVLVAAGEDSLVPIEHARRVAASARGPTRWLEDQAAGHDGLLDRIAADGRLIASLRWIAAQPGQARCEEPVQASLISRRRSWR